MEATFWGFDDDREAQTGYVWEYRLADFSEPTYRTGVEALFSSFEQLSGRALEPGPRRRVGIKVYTNSGEGLTTPTNLVAGVIASLEARGFQRNEIFLIDVRNLFLREGSFLPALSRRDSGPYFRGVPVYALENGGFFNDVWYYDNPLPSQSAIALRADLLGDYYSEEDPEERRSYLPVPLLTGVDFWINLPVAVDHPALGLSGAVANATLWNVSNRDRFFVSPANAPIAMAEIAAIPEMLAGWAMTILPLERYQYIGGPRFNSLYTESERLLWMSVDPVVLDSMILEKIDAARARRGFRPLGPMLPVLEYAAQLGVGEPDPATKTMVELP